MTMRSNRVMAFDVAIALLELALMAYCGLCSVSVAAAELSPGEASLRLDSVVVRESHVLATAGNRLYRAALENKRWQPVRLPEQMPPAGRLVASPTAQNTVFLYVSAWALQHQYASLVGKSPGLYCSRDAGDSWEVLSKDPFIECFYPHGDGAFYVYTYRSPETTAQPAEPPLGNFPPLAPDQGRLIVSRDFGKTWQDITPEDRRGKHLGRFLGIQPDPEYAKRIYFEFDGVIRHYSVRALDDDYLHWEMHPLVPAPKQTDEQFLADGRGYYSSSHYYFLRATLGNYFDCDFEGTNQRSPFDLRIQTTNFSFRVGEPCVVPVELHYLLPDRTVKLADFAAGTNFWNIRYITPDGRRLVGQSPNAQQATNAPAGQSIGSAPWQVVELSAAKPYHRELDLRMFGDFSAAGTYRVVLAYDSSRWRKAGDESDGWLGGFGSRIFTVSIKP